MNTTGASTNGIAREDLVGTALRDAITRRNGVNAIPSDAELDASRAEWLADLSPDQELWVFAYGSLVWNPIFPVAEQRRARLFGFHRSFCMTSTIGRGTTERPGLMLALDNGGTVDGIALKMGQQNRDEEIRLLWRREMLPMSYRPLRLSVQTQRGPVTALTFVADPSAPSYVGNLPLVESAEIIRGAAGLLGTNLDYLDSTHHALTRHGIDDPYLRSLLALCRGNKN